MLVLPQNTMYGAAPVATTSMVSATHHMLPAAFASTSCGFAASTIAGGYSLGTSTLSMAPQFPTTPSKATLDPYSPTTTSFGTPTSISSPVSPLDLSPAMQTYSLSGSTTGMASTAMSPIQFNSNAYAMGPLNTTAMPAVGSQSSQFLGLQEKNNLRDQGVAHVMSSDPTEQDSDLMERMADGMYYGCKASGEVPLVSLGCSCGPKLSFKDIGRGAETLPFDWSRTRVEALLQFISTGFAGFFDTAPNYIAYADEGGSEWRAFRGPLHSFWHDDPYAPAMRERYGRRIKRFFEINATYQPVLFVRAVASTSEVPRTLELLQLLKNKFGPQAKLLLIVDFQGPSAIGLARLAGNDNLLLCSLDTKNQPSQAAPYGQVVQAALKWAIGQPIQAVQLSSVQDFQARLVSNDWGLYGAAQVPAFV